MSSKPKELKELIEEANHEFSDLNVFAAVVALMESSLVHINHYKTEARIVSICKAEQQDCLRRYDRAMALVNHKMGMVP